MCPENLDNYRSNLIHYYQNLPCLRLCLCQIDMNTNNTLHLISIYLTIRRAIISAHAPYILKKQQTYIFFYIQQQKQKRQDASLFCNTHSDSFYEVFVW
jgi:hypothetical protein